VYCNSCAAKIRWTDESHNEKIDAHWRNSDFRAKHSDAVKAALSDPVAKKKESDASKARWAIPENRERYSNAIKEAQRARWAKFWGYTSWDDVPHQYKNFTERLRELIRSRQDRKCAFCGEAEGAIKLDVHHIDYDKTNSVPDNLIALCHTCHTKTSKGKDRELWTEKSKYFVSTYETI
jgi:5-methylcytosine-specific restriction endonuclease McrA